MMVIKIHAQCVVKEICFKPSDDRSYKAHTCREMVLGLYLLILVEICSLTGLQY